MHTTLTPSAIIDDTLHQKHPQLSTRNTTKTGQKHTKPTPQCRGSQNANQHTETANDTRCALQTARRHKLRDDLFDQTDFTRLHRHPNATHLPVRKFNLHALKIRLKNARPLFRYVRPDTAALLRLTFPTDARTDHALLPRDKTNACHRMLPKYCLQGTDFYSPPQAFSKNALSAETDADAHCTDFPVNHDHTETLALQKSVFVKKQKFRTYKPLRRYIFLHPPPDSVPLRRMFCNLIRKFLLYFPNSKTASMLATHRNIGRSTMCAF